MFEKGIKVFLRFAIGFDFLSAVADRLGFWQSHVAWGNWPNFVHYTATLLPFLPHSFIPVLAWMATIAEIVFGLCLIIGLKTKSVAILSGILMLLFALSMTFSSGIKTAFDASVYAAAAGAFALSLMKTKCLELEALWSKK